MYCWMKPTCPASLSSKARLSWLSWMVCHVPAMTRRLPITTPSNTHLVRILLGPLLATASLGSSGIIQCP